MAGCICGMPLWIAARQNKKNIVYAMDIEVLLQHFRVFVLKNGIFRHLWNVLSSFVKYSAKYLKSKTEWLDGKNGIDVLGFSVIPAGIYPNDPYINEDFDIINEAFIGIYEDLIGQHACFWSAEQSGNAMSFDADYYQFFSDAYAFCFANEDEHIYSDLAPKTLGLSVRCVKDSLADE